MEDHGERMQGRRLSDGHHRVDAQPGDFWKEVYRGSEPYGKRGERWQWTVCDPHGNLGTILSMHEVYEHADGSITVFPSLHDVSPGGYHGQIKKGEWHSLEAQYGRPLRAA